MVDSSVKPEIYGVIVQGSLSNLHIVYGLLGPIVVFRLQLIPVKWWGLWSKRLRGEVAS